MVYRAPGPAPVPEPAPTPEPEVVSLSIGGKSHAVTSPKVVIGRSRDCDLRISDLNASRRHAELQKDGDGYWIVDLGSMNGTQVNGRPVDRQRLEDGDRITLGSTEIVFGRKSAVRDRRPESGFKSAE
jgi:pSer/pThr/pTyr-binding forkhead associated (FHA) protein